MSDNILFSVNDPRGYYIICTKDQWVSHVIDASGHPIMSDNVSAVCDTIQNPDCIYVSNQYNNRHVYFSKSVNSTYKIYTKVIVETNGTEGYLITAFPQKDISGGIDAQKGLLYVKNKL